MNPEKRKTTVEITFLAVVIGGIFLAANAESISGMITDSFASQEEQAAPPAITGNVVAGDELSVQLSGGGFYDRRGYFLPSSSGLTISASGKPPLRIVVDGNVAKECNAGSCSHSASYEKGIHLYHVSSADGRTPLNFFQIGSNARTDTPECRNDELDLSRDSYVEQNDMHKIFDVISGSACTVTDCDINPDGRIDDSDAYALAKIVNSCFN